MLTQCPRCGRRLACSPAGLPATRGLVCCGHCRAVFNAWLFLLEADPAPVDEPSGPRMSEIPSEPPPPREPPALAPRTRPDRGDWAAVMGRDVDPEPMVGTRAAAVTVPVDPPWYRQERRPEKSPLAWLWAVGLVVLLLLFLAQVLWLQGGPIASAWPVTRALWVQLCDHLGCEPPWQRDVARIKVRQSDVREQPGQQDRLLVTVTLVNEAGFEQPYPAIDLSLGDGTEPATARRRFSPEEYLGPEGRYSFLPVGQPVAVVLELAGRHALATTYTIELH